MTDHLVDANKKEWQTLSQYEIDRLIGRLQVVLPYSLEMDVMTEFARAIEAKLKEKNT